MTPKFCPLPPHHVRKLALYKSAEPTTRFIAKQPFQYCPACRASPGAKGIELRHWRFAWTINCKRCDGQLAPFYLGRAGKGLVTKNMIQKAGQGAKILARAAQTNNTKDLRRVQSAIRFSDAYLNIHSPTSALFSGNHYDRLFCLAAISAAQNYPLAKVAWLIANSSFATRDRIYRAFEDKPILRQKLISLRGKFERFVHTKTYAEGHLADLLPNPDSKPKTKYQHASYQAIAELGSGVGRRKLLRRADEILNAV